MKAAYTIQTYKNLNSHRRRIIVYTATREQDDHYTRVARLKKLNFCTDAVKFETLYRSEQVSKELYDDLYRLYFNAPPKTDKGKETETMSRRIHWTEENTAELINAYTNGLRGAELADKMGMDLIAVKNRLQRLRKDPKYKEMLTMNQTNTKTNTTPAVAEEPITETAPETTVAEEPIAPKVHDSLSKMPQCFSAYGSGFITTDGGLKLDEEPILTAIRQKIMERGLRQFYGEVSILIYPREPAGMTVRVED
jgi:DNA-directed RNA polymerase specialized sigma24 family protein